MKLVFVIWILLCIPFLNILAAIGYLALKIYYGIKGNEWAYQNRAWWSIEDFESTQRRWAIAVAVMYGVAFGSAIVLLIMGLILSLMQ